MIDKDYENFVARMGSFDMDTEELINPKDELQHFGIPGMKWGHRKSNNQPNVSNRDIKRAEKLSKKYGIKVGVGVKEKEVLGAAKTVGQLKTNAKFAAVEKYNNDTLSYYTDINGKRMSDKEFKRITDKTNKILAYIDKTSIIELSEKKREDGKRYVDIKLNS